MVKPTYSSWLALFVIPSLCGYNYHQLAPPQAFSITLLAMTMLFGKLDCAPKTDSMFPSVVTATHTHCLLRAGQNGLPPTLDNLHLGCSYHLQSSHHFLSTWGPVMLRKKKRQPKLICKVPNTTPGIPPSHILNSLIINASLDANAHRKLGKSTSIATE